MTLSCIGVTPSKDNGLQGTIQLREGNLHVYQVLDLVIKVEYKGKKSSWALSERFTLRHLGQYDRPV